MNYRVIFHIDERTKWSLLLSNVSNLVNEIQEQTRQVIVLVNSEAVLDTTTASKHFSKIRELLLKGVSFKVCNNALKNNNIIVKDLISGTLIVKAGVLELVERQNEGFAYIKP